MDVITFENEKIFTQKRDNRRTFWWKISLFPFHRKRGGHDVQVSFQSVARFTIVRQMAPLPSGLNAAMENNVIAAHLVHL